MLAETKLGKRTENQNRLPAIIQYNTKPVVSARELYEILGLALQHWVKWYTKNILKNGFAIQNDDWTELPQSGRSRDFALSLEFAKRLSMMARTARGEEIRNYFIACERQAIESSKPRTQIEILLESIQILHAQEKKISVIETRVDQLEAQSATSLGYYSICGFAALKKRSIDVKIAAALGAKAKAASRVLGCVIGKIPDPRFGKVNTYPEEVLEDVFKDYFAVKP